MLLDQHFHVQRLRGCYFHSTQIVVRKVNEIRMKEDYKKNDSLRLAIRCLPTLDMVPSSDVTDVFLILTDNRHFFNVITLPFVKVL